MHAGNAADRERRGRDIVRTLPAWAREGDSAARQPVDGREREAFRFAVIPAETREHSHIVSNLLFNVYASPILRCTVAAHSRDIRYRAGLRTHSQSFGIVARIDVQSETE